MTITLSPKKTEAWAPKLKKRSKSFDISRPVTATLDHPLVLDVALLKKLDMTVFTKKGLLAISKLCGISLLQKGNSTRRSLSYISKRHSKKQAFTEIIKKDKKGVLFDPEYSSWEDESSASELKLKKSVKKLPSKLRKQNEEDSWADEESGASDVKNRKRTEKIFTKLGETRVIAAIKKSKGVPKRSGAVDYVFGVPVNNAIPEPCKTCGRAEQSERFHSHPKIKMPENSKVVKSVIQKTAIMKPIPAKFKSGEKSKRESYGDGQTKSETSIDKQRGEKTVLNLTSTAGRPRTITCYICCREFGTASFPLHEPKCIQKWERENALLEPELRRKLPEKPEGVTSLEEWNEFAWKVAQMSLVPCEKCGRTFNPDRLQVHSRVCKESSSKVKIPDRPSTGSRPRTVPCEICGREFGTQSIEIHKPQCLKKWNVEKNRQAIIKPIKPVIEVIEDSIDSIWADHMESLVPCPKCGRRFFSDRVERHVSCCNNQPVNVKCKSSRK